MLRWAWTGLLLQLAFVRRSLAALRAELAAREDHRLAGAPAGGREPIPLMCTVASGPGIHSLLGCQRTILDSVELAGVPSPPMSLCMSCLSLASFSGIFQRGWKELMAVND